MPHGDLASGYRGEETLRFERISQSWLKEAAKRWARARLLADTAPRTMSAYRSFRTSGRLFLPPLFGLGGGFEGECLKF